MANIRNTVVIRKDLNLGVGPLAAQVAHIGAEFMRRNWTSRKPNAKEKEWLESPYIYIHQVLCKDDLELLIKKLQDSGCDFYTWEDTVPSPSFENEWIKTLIGVAIGPEDTDKVKEVIGSLELLRE